MKKRLLRLFGIMPLFVAAQTFPVGHMSINFKDASRASGGYVISGGINVTGSGRDVGTEVYYPATAAGNNQPVASGQFPVVVFGHGFVMSWDAYDNVYNQLASKGYIVLLPRTEGGFSPVHADFGADLSFLANAGLGLNNISTPSNLVTFNGKILQKSAIGGHSMGAGSSFLAAASNTSITCLFNFAAATTNPSSISSASLVTVPTLMVSGARDCVADTTVQNSHYSALASGIKFHVILSQLTHCDFGNGTNFNCTFGQGSSGCGNQVSNALAFPRYMNYLQNFLDNQLKNDCAAGQRFMDSVNTASSIRSGLKKQGSIICITTGLNQHTATDFLSVYPNPAADKLNVAALTNMKEIRLQLFDITGKLMMEERIGQLQPNIPYEFSLEDLDAGTYLLSVSGSEGTHTFRIIKN